MSKLVEKFFVDRRRGTVRTALPWEDFKKLYGVAPDRLQLLVEGAVNRAGGDSS